MEFETFVTDVIKRTENVKSFRFNLKQKIAFKAGQYFFVTIKISNQEKTKHFSFSNSPTEDGYVEFTKKITSSDYSKALDNLKVKDWARLRMPYGKFILKKEHKKIAFLSGGIGITPIRSICKYVKDTDSETDIVLLYGSNQESDIIFKDDLDQLNRDRHIRVIHTLTSKNIDANKWKGETGFIDDVMIKKYIPDFNEREFFVCGPVKMVENLKNILVEKIKIDKVKVISENFPGY